VNIEYINICQVYKFIAECSEVELVKRFFIYWRRMRETAKERQKVNELVRALTHFKKEEIADTVTDAAANNEEIPGPPVPEILEEIDDTQSESMILGDGETAGTTTASTASLQKSVVSKAK